MEEIVHWLEAGAQADYQTGVRLLEQHTKNRTLINHLARKDSKANREKLTYELLKAGLDGDLAAVNEATQLLALQAQPDTTEFAPAVADAVPLPEPEQAPEAEQVPEAVREQVQDITERMSQTWAERCQLSNQLDAASDEQGKVLVADILRLQEQYNVLAERRRQLLAGEATGQENAHSGPGAAESGQQVASALPAPGEPAIVPAAVLELADTLRNVRSNLSKARRKLAAKPGDVKLEEKVAKLVIERDQLELQLKKATE